MIALSTNESLDVKIARLEERMTAADKALSLAQQHARTLTAAVFALSVALVASVAGSFLTYVLMRKP